MKNTCQICGDLEENHLSTHQFKPFKKLKNWFFHNNQRMMNFIKMEIRK